MLAARGALRARCPVAARHAAVRGTRGAPPAWRTAADARGPLLQQRCWIRTTQRLCAAAASAPASSQQEGHGQGAAGAAAAAAAAALSDATVKVKPKKAGGLMAWLWDQLLHVWYGFKLLAANTRMATRLHKQMKSGQKLTRRERQLLERTTADLLRLVPFSLFIIIPAGELLLPVALAIFPNLMPSTFVTGDQMRKRLIMENLQSGVAKRRMFEHMTARIMLEEKFQGDSPSLALFRSIKESGVVTAADIRHIVPYFADDGPLGLQKLPGYILRDLCKVTHTYSRLQYNLLPQSWYEARMRYALVAELEKREEDDKNLAQSSDTLTPQELESECSKRRMRWYGPPDALKRQLDDWLSLSTDASVPDHVLLFVQPCATPKDAMWSFLDKKEVDHILGLDKFRDTPMQQALREIQSRSTKLSREEIERRVMEDDIEDLKARVERVHRDEEAAACGDQFVAVRALLGSITPERLGELFNELSKESTVSKESPAGVSITELARGIVRLMEAECTDAKMDWPKYTSEVTLMLRQFDMDNTDVISTTEFDAVLSRLQDCAK
eukprot:TRINITY_DN50943_c0_g1_i1.p1 TRINITY_DN50943_c0_g1~~TRINITY_DN50943_c0_g1_i1.p1  ORF type:complete len:583 (+),score=204.67 TRINITY_DN50943_c0_g1_i1:84-1751(+)